MELKDLFHPLLRELYEETSDGLELFRVNMLLEKYQDKKKYTDIVNNISDVKELLRLMAIAKEIYYNPKFINANCIKVVIEKDDDKTISYHVYEMDDNTFDFAIDDIKNIITIAPGLSKCIMKRLKRTLPSLRNKLYKQYKDETSPIVCSFLKYEIENTLQDVANMIEICNDVKRIHCDVYEVIGSNFGIDLFPVTSLKEINELVSQIPGYKEFIDIIPFKIVNIDDEDFRYTETIETDGKIVVTKTNVSSDILEERSTSGYIKAATYAYLFSDNEVADIFSTGNKIWSIEITDLLKNKTVFETSCCKVESNTTYKDALHFAKLQLNKMVNEAKQRKKQKKIV